MQKSRRKFIRQTMTGMAAASIGGILPAFSAKSYANIIGANNRLLVGVMGVNSRGGALSRSFSKAKDCEIIHISDVDSRAAEKCIASIAQITNKRPKATPDFRKALEDKQMDAIVVAAPDHWHAPAAILASKAGKHVYLEKPCSHNPNEGELLMAAVQKYKNVIQMGNQRRSFPNIIAGMKELHEGIIGKPHYARTWYANNRPSIGVGKQTEVPSWLDYELWQGPAPRKAFKDNLIHYNWHWFWHWGTGEALNNGTHFVDLARWGLQVDYPTLVTSAGGRFRYKDDWETPDTQMISLEFDNSSMMTWEGRSCNSAASDGAGVGLIFYGEKGFMKIEGGNAYSIYDMDNKPIKEVKSTAKLDTRDLTDPFKDLDVVHINNFLDTIRGKDKLNSDIVSGHQSTLLVQLGNIAQRTGETLKIDPKNGHILNSAKANALWSRQYQPGWEPKI
ncbi:MAG: Gfo/Idh/MocA family oxidoreductase [Chitinophagaceae bacterium]|nr:Gfo/Idh/MocA family oxidoreductase [Chitinophagaceae bacterium]